MVFRELPNLFYIAISLLIIYFGTDISVYPGNILLIEIGILMLISVLGHIRYLLKRRALQGSVGGKFYRRMRQAVQKGKKILQEESASGIKVFSNEIVVGDILRLKKYDVSPCDGIILGSRDQVNSEYVCHVDNLLSNGEIQRDIKWAVKLTRSFSHLVFDERTIIDFIKRITGKVQIHDYKHTGGKFKGTFKLKKDPKVELLDDSYILFRGTRVRSPDVFILVSHTGNNTRSKVNTSIKFSKTSTVHGVLRMYTFLCIILNFVLTLGSTIILFVRNGSNTILSKIDPNVSNGFRFVTFLILYSPIVPLTMLLLVDVSNMIYSAIIEKKYYNFRAQGDCEDMLEDEDHLNIIETTAINSRSSSKQLENSVNVLNPHVLPDLGTTQYIFFDKTGTLLSPDYELVTVASQSKIYSCKKGNFLAELNLTAKYKDEKQLSEEDLSDDDIKQSDLDKMSEGVSDFGASHDIKYTRNISFSEKNPLSIHSKTSKTNNFMNTEDNILMSSGRGPEKDTFGSPSKKNLGSSKTRTDGQAIDIMKNMHTEGDFVKDASSDPEIVELMKVFLTCQKSTPNKDSFDSKLIEEKSMLTFAKNFYYTFKAEEADRPDKSSVVFHNRKVTFFYKGREIKSLEIPLVNEHDVERNRFSLVAYNPSTEVYTLYVRGVSSSMVDTLEYSQAYSGINDVIEHNNELGLKTFIYAKKELTKEQFERYSESYSSYKKTLLDQKPNMMKLAIEMESQLTLVSMVGLRSKRMPGAFNTIQKCKDMGIKVSMLTGDDHDHSMMALKLLNFVGDDFMVEVLEFDDIDSGVSRIKDVLENMKRRISNDKKPKKSGDDLRRTSTSVMTEELEELSKFVLMVSGKSLEIILKHRFLRSHFFFISQFADSIIGFSMTSRHKSDFIKGFRHSHHGRSKIITCVGDGYNDIGMLREASIGVQLLSPDVDIIFGDIVLGNLTSLTSIMQHDARGLHSNIKQVMMVFFGRSFSFALLNFFYQFFCGFTGAPITIYPLLEISTIINFIQGLVYVLFEEKYSRQVEKSVPALYSESDFATQSRVANFLFEFVSSILQTLFVFYFALYSNFDHVTNSSGQVSSVLVLTLTVTISFEMLFSFKLAIRSMSFSFGMLLITILKGIILAASLWFLSNTFYYSPIYEPAWQMIFGNINYLYVFLFSCAFPLVLDWMLWDSIIMKRWFPMYLELKRLIKAGEWEKVDSSDNERYLLRSFKIPESFSSVVTNSFSSQDEIDLTIESLLSQKGEDNIKVNNVLLNFQTEQLEKKYKMFSLKKFITTTRIQLIGSLIILVIISLLLILNQATTQEVLSGVGLSILVFVMVLFSMTLAFKSHIHMGLIVYMISIIGGATFTIIVRKSDYTLLAIVVLQLIITNYNLSFGNVLSLVGCLILSYIISMIIVYPDFEGSLWIDGSDTMVSVYTIVSLASLAIIFMLVTLIQRYKNEKLLKNEFKSGSNMKNKSSITKELLSLLLPKFVLDRMQNYEVTDITIGDDVGSVSILFCDIAEFDSVIRENEQNIVRILDNLFRRFDEICTVRGIQKIETVGKTYMAAGGLSFVESGLPANLKSKNPTTRILEVSKDMMEAIKDFQGLKLKIGVHHGKCMMGVIGYHKPQFSLIGDAVNTTSRHCTTGQPGHIMMSKEAWRYIDEGYAKSNGYEVTTVKVFMKGKGDVDVFHVFQKSNLFLKKIKHALKKGEISNGFKEDEIKTLNKVFTKDRRKATKNAKFMNIVNAATERMKRLQKLGEFSKENERVGDRKKSKYERTSSKDDMGVNDVALAEVEESSDEDEV